MSLLTRGLAFSACLFATSALLAAEDSHRDELDARMEECQRQREENIAPLREQAVAADRYFRMNPRRDTFTLP